MGPILKHGFSRAAVAGTKFITWLLTLVLRFTIHGLETRKKYVFRVKSVSHAGNSNYSEESEAILVKAAISKDSTQLNQKKKTTDESTDQVCIIQINACVTQHPNSKISVVSRKGK